MQDDGNFVLRNENSNPIWQSFDSPTDTLLPGKTIPEGTRLFSNANGITNFSTGKFLLEMQNDGNLVLSAYQFAEPGYWYTDTVRDNVNVSLVFNQTSGYLDLKNSDNNNTIKTLNSDVPNYPLTDYYHRAIIESNGNFQHLVYPKNNGSVWEQVWRAFDDPCWPTSICGVYGFCSSNNNETISCKCLPGYIPLDPNMPSNGCRQEIISNYCAHPQVRNFTVEVIDDADFPSAVNADLAGVVNVDVEGCKRSLIEDCYSVAAALRNSTCYKKRVTLLNGHKGTSTKGATVFIKVPIKIDVSSPSSILAFIFGLLAVYYHPGAQKLVKRKSSSENNMIGINFREFTYQEIQEATNGFSKTIGRGSSGKVYSGTLCLSDVQIGIAVKKIEKMSERGEREFMTELKIIGRTHHKNLVRLLGFCIEDDQRILVYELMKKGTLSDFLFNEPGKRPGWTERSEMAIGIAKGLLYLHEMVKVGVWCVHEDSFLRPSMKKVVQMLEGTMEVEIPPLVYQE